MRTTIPQKPSGASLVKSRNVLSKSAASSAGRTTTPAYTWLTGCSANSNPVTTPKPPPPPRNPQNRSGCSSVLARTNRPSASTTETPRRLSTASPNLRISQPAPPPRVNPPTPVLETIPPVVASPQRAAATSTSCQSAPPCTSTTRLSACTDTARIRDRSISSAPSATARPATLCPPARTVTGRPCSVAMRSVRVTSSASSHLTIPAGMRSIDAFQPRRATAYVASPGRRSSPRMWRRSASTV